jgi:hypothetical protein
MACSKYTLTNTGSTAINFNYRRCDDSMWEYQVNLDPNQTKNIWLINGTYQIAQLFAPSVNLVDDGVYPLTPTPTPSITPTATPTPTASVTPTLTPTASVTPTVTTTSTITPTPTTSVTPTVTATSTATPTPTVTSTATPTPTVTSTETPTPTVTSTPPPSATPTPTNTETPTPTPTNTETPTPTPTITPTITPTPNSYPYPLLGLDAVSSTNACAGAAAGQTYYGTVATFSLLTIGDVIYNTSSLTTTIGAFYVSDGSNYVQTNGSGVIIAGLTAC